MKLVNCCRNIKVTVLLLLVAVLSHAQTPWTVTLNGKVVEDDKPLARAILILKNNGEEVKKVITAPNGKFTLVLESDNDYELYFTKKGYVTKFISYNTQNVPEDKIAGLYGEFIFELELFKEMEGLNTSVLEFPVFKVKYYPGLKNLDYDKKHENKIRSRLSTLLKEYKAAKEKEKDMAANTIAAEEKRKIDKAYNEQLEIASVLLKEKKYEEAQDAYEKALVVKPSASFPKEKIVAIEKLIKERDKTKKLSKEMEERYAVLIKTADGAFAKERYASAKSLYKRASLIAPDRPYPQNQIALAKEELSLVKGNSLATSAVNTKFNLIKDRADNEFMGEDYVRARTSYLAALKLIPDEAYVKGRIKEIDGIIAESRKAMVVVEDAPKSKKAAKSKKGVKKGAPDSTEEDLNSYLTALAEEYDEGITEEIQVEGGKKVTRIIVVKDGKANEYKKEVYSWATYYKKNNKTIPRYLFESETKK